MTLPDTVTGSSLLPVLNPDILFSEYDPADLIDELISQANPDQSRVTVLINILADNQPDITSVVSAVKRLSDAQFQLFISHIWNGGWSDSGRRIALNNLTQQVEREPNGDNTKNTLPFRVRMKNALIVLARENQGDTKLSEFAESL